MRNSSFACALTAFCAGEPDCDLDLVWRDDTDDNGCEAIPDPAELDCDLDLVPDDTDDNGCEAILDPGEPDCDLVLVTDASVGVFFWTYDL